MRIGGDLEEEGVRPASLSLSLLLLLSSSLASHGREDEEELVTTVAGRWGPQVDCGEWAPPVSNSMGDGFFFFFTKWVWSFGERFGEAKQRIVYSG